MLVATYKEESGRSEVMVANNSKLQASAQELTSHRVIPRSLYPAGIKNYSGKVIHLDETCTENEAKGISCMPDPAYTAPLLIVGGAGGKGIGQDKDYAYEGVTQSWAWQK